MKKIILSFIAFFLFACGSNDQKQRVTELLKGQIGSGLPFNDVKIAEIENGTGVIVDGNWCYWINSENKIFCVNGASKTIYNSINTIECEDAPIDATFLDIEKIAK